MRFATPEIGWLYGPALFGTADGGHSWTREPAPSVVDLEAANRVVMRVTTTDYDCGDGCNFTISRSRVRSRTWTRIPHQVFAFPTLILQGSATYAIDYPNGAGAGQTMLSRSDDNGARWQAIADPCPGPSAGYRTMSASAAPDAVLVVLCPPVDPAPTQIRVSTDGGRTFGPRRNLPLVDAGSIVPVAAASARTISVAYGGLHRYGVVVTHDGGRSWKAARTTPTPPSRADGWAPMIGWGGASTGRVSFNTSFIRTTRDSGAAWTGSNVGS